MKISSKEIHVLKNLLVGKTFAEVAGILGVSSFANSDFKSTTSILKSEEFDRIQEDLLLAYKENINKPDFEKLKNKIVINTVKLGLSPALLHFYRPSQEPNKGQIKPTKSSPKIKVDKGLTRKERKQLKTGITKKPAAKPTIGPKSNFEKFIEKTRHVRYGSRNQHDGRYYFLHNKLKPYYANFYTIAKFEKAFKILEGQVVAYISSLGKSVKSDDRFTFEIAEKISPRLYDLYLERKLEESNREAYYASTKNKLPKTKPNYYKLIFTR